MRHYVKHYGFRNRESFLYRSAKKKVLKESVDKSKGKEYYLGT